MNCRIKSLQLAGLLLLGVSVPVKAETAAKTNEAQNVSSSAIPGEKTDSSFFVSVGPGLAMYGGNLGWSVNIGALSQLGKSRNIFYGLDTALNFWSSQTATAPLANVSASATGVQILPTILYRFEIAGPSIFPYIGASIGPNIYIDRQTVGTSSQTNTSLFFEFLVRPGFFTSLGRTVSLQVEGKFGLLRSSFIFLPQANAVFAL